MKKIKIKLIDILKDQDRSINWLAKKINVNYSVLYKFIHGQTQSVNYDVLEKIANELNLNLTDIMDFEIVNNTENDE